MESKYTELLKAYRTAHARIQAVESFEASLRENTPLTSVNDANALVEYLNQMNLKSDMVVDELKRVTADRDEQKKKAQASEEEAKKLAAEVTELKKKHAELETVNGEPTGDTEKFSSIGSPRLSVPGDSGSVVEVAESEQLKSPSSTTSRIASFSLFSPRPKPQSPPAPKETSEEFFSYETEQSNMEAELQSSQVQVAELKKQVSNLTGDLKVARESTESMVTSLETATRELHTLRDAKDKFDERRQELQQRIDELEAKATSNTTRTDELGKELEALRYHKDQALSQLRALEDQIQELEKQNNELKQQMDSRDQDANILNEKLTQKDSIVKDIEDSLAMYKSAERQEAAKKDDDTAGEKKLATMQSIMDTLRGQLDKAETTVAELKADIKSNQEEFSRRPSTKVFGFLDETAKSNLDALKSRDDVVRYLSENFGLQKPASLSPPEAQPLIPSPAPSEAGTTSSKKKNKKKKKGKGQQATEDTAEVQAPVKVSENLAEADEAETSAKHTASTDSVARLEQQISELKSELSSKSDAIERLTKQLKDQEALKEEIETLRDDLLHQGEEHVEARDALKEAHSQKSNLQESVDRLEKELLEARTAVAGGADKEKLHQEILQQHEELKAKCSSLEQDLGASEQLAAGRFKDITDLKDLLAKAQPELRSLRAEVAELKTAKEDLKNKTGELSRLESRHEDMKSELKGLSKRLGDKDVEIRELNQKIEQETATRTRLENDLEKAQHDLTTSEARRQETTSHASVLEKDLSRAKEESAMLRGKIRELDNEASAASREIASLREELNLKTALHTSAQALVSSLRDQTQELNMQAREASTRADNLEEELSEAQRMLTERTREAQTMRMLLDQSNTGTESRIREMRERMDKALEERDRVEDEANVAQRRMMREVEEARAKVRDAQRGLKVLEDEKDELESRMKEWKRRRDELEEVSSRASREVEEVKAAMAGLREALDESERQVRELDIQKADLRRAGDESKERVEKLTKANKNLTEELKIMQARVPGRPGLRGVDSNAPSSRTSIDSTNANARSPAPKERGLSSNTVTSRSETPTSATGQATGLSQGTVDYVYLKNVLLQFLEQKDKGHQRQLIPVLGMLLHFDR
jgi:chromosome segregation ATPase